MANRIYPWEKISGMRASGQSWDEIMLQLGVSFEQRSSLSKMFSKWRLRQIESGKPDPMVEFKPGPGSNTPPDLRTVQVEVHSPTGRRIQTLDDIVSLLEVDLDEWVVQGLKGKAYEQHSVAKGIVTQLSVGATFTRNLEAQARRAREIILSGYEDLKNLSPYRLAREPYRGKAMAAICVFDAHFGMLAWGRETHGPDYDLDWAEKEYGDAVAYLVEKVSHLDLDYILFVVGNDMIHVDRDGDGGKGGATAKGTAQDVDTRRAKIFSVVRRALIRGIETARARCRVVVKVVPGNHDTNEMYRMGEVLMSWYRNDPDVEVEYGPAPRSYHAWGKNLIGLTHGEEFYRKRDPLAVIMPQEVPQLWGASTYREWLTGHFHARREGEVNVYLSEHQGVRVIGLPGLTPGDAWHGSEGYRHWRAAAARCYQPEGGVVESYEFPILRRDLGC